MKSCCYKEVGSNKDNLNWWKNTFTFMSRCHFLCEGLTFLLVSYFDFSKWYNNKICINFVQWLSLATLSLIIPAILYWNILELKCKRHDFGYFEKIAFSISSFPWAENVKTPSPDYQDIVRIRDSNISDCVILWVKVGHKYVSACGLSLQLSESSIGN